MEHNLQDLSLMCNQTLENIEQIIQQSRQLYVVDTDLRRIRRKRRQVNDFKEGDEENG